MTIQTQGKIRITREGQICYTDYKQNSLHYTILVVLYQQSCTMLELVDKVRRERDEFRFMQPKEIIRVLVELQHAEYVINTYRA